MKSPLAGKATLLVALPLAALAVAALAQLSEAPPVKMGLWQAEYSGHVTGLENTPMAGLMANAERSHVTQSCMTADSWKRDIQGVNERRGCTMTNLHQDSHEVSFDEACSSGRGTDSTTHVDMIIDNSEHAHGTTTMKMMIPNAPNAVIATTTIETHFLSSDCGNIRPGSAKLIK